MRAAATGVGDSGEGGAHLETAPPAPAAIGDGNELVITRAGAGWTEAETNASGTFRPEQRRLIEGEDGALVTGSRLLTSEKQRHHPHTSRPFLLSPHLQVLRAPRPQRHRISTPAQQSPQHQEAHQHRRPRSSTIPSLAGTEKRHPPPMPAASACKNKRNYALLDFRSPQCLLSARRAPPHQRRNVSTFLR